jgi:hypothetical protein
MARVPQQVTESEQQRVERVRNEERKRLAARTAEQLSQRFGVDDGTA